GSLLREAAGGPRTTPVQELLDGLTRAVAGPTTAARAVEMPPPPAPVIEAPPPAPQPEPRPAQRSGPPAPAPKAKRGERAPRAEDTVRVATAKLDALMALVGELSVSQVGTGLHLERLEQIEGELAAWASWCRKRRLDGRRSSASGANGEADG